MGECHLCHINLQWYIKSTSNIYIKEAQLFWADWWGCNFVQGLLYWVNMEKISLIPAPGFILLKIVETQSDTLLVAMDTDKTPASTGVVIAVGAPALHESGGYYEAKVNMGDLVVLKPYGVDSIYLNNDEHRIVPFSNIRGILKNE